MASYLAMLNWTDEGIHNVKKSPERLDAFKQAVKDAGGRVIFFYMTLGQYDMATLVEVADDATYTKLLLSVGALGSIRTTTLKAFTEEEYRGIIGSLP